MKKLVSALILSVCLSGNVLIPGNALAATKTKIDPCTDAFAGAKALRHKVSHDNEYNNRLVFTTLLLYCGEKKRAEEEANKLVKQEIDFGRNILLQCEYKEPDKAIAPKLFLEVYDSYKTGFVNISFRQYKAQQISEKKSEEAFCADYISSTEQAINKDNAASD